MRKQLNKFYIFIKKQRRIYFMIPYKHEPFTDFSLDENKEALNKGFETIKKDFGSDYPLIINGERILTDKKLESYNPAKKSEVIGNMSQDRKSTRLNSSHVSISYAVFCLKKKNRT